MIIGESVSFSVCFMSHLGSAVLTPACTRWRVRAALKVSWSDCQQLALGTRARRFTLRTDCFHGTPAHEGSGCVPDLIVCANGIGSAGQIAETPWIVSK